jgi:CRISPR-associated protein Cmx8
VGRFVRENYPEMPDDRSWLKLWREMMWNIVRGRPTTRSPYNQRADGQHCKEGPDAWADLLRVEKARQQGGFHTSEVSSALLPGAQAINAELVPFQGRSEENLLLHFWPLAVLLFTPQQVDRDGSSEFVGYTIAIPEVSNLRQFTEDYVEMLSRLNDGLKPEHAARGFRPTRSVIDLAAEGALALLDSLAQIAGRKLEEGELRFSISGAEYLHLVKMGNNIKTMAAGRVSPFPRLLEEYHNLVNPREESQRYRNPLFRRGLLMAMLEGVPWYRPHNETLEKYDAKLFIRPSRRPENPEEKGMPHFASDALKRFQYESARFTKSLNKGKAMSEAGKSREKAPLSVIVDRVVRTYLRERAEARSGVKLAQFDLDGRTDWAKVPSEFNEWKQKLAQSLLLEFRSRKDQAFVDHFAATFFSVTQRIAEADRLELAEALTGAHDRDQRRDDLKTLTLLSLSANS